MYRQAWIWVFALAPTLALGAPITVGSETDFLGAVTGDVIREGFEGFSTDTGCASGGSSPATSLETDFFAVSTSTSSSSTPSFLCVGTSEVSGRDPRPTEGVNALNAGGGGEDGFTLSFLLDAAVSAVYFELTDAAERGDVVLRINGLGDFLVAECCVSTLSPIAFGIILDPGTFITSFELLNDSRFDGWGIDNIVLELAASTAVTEPGSFALLGLALAGLGFSRRRRSS